MGAKVRFEIIKPEKPFYWGWCCTPQLPHAQSRDRAWGVPVGSGSPHSHPPAHALCRAAAWCTEVAKPTTAGSGAAPSTTAQRLRKERAAFIGLVFYDINIGKCFSLFIWF